MTASPQKSPGRASAANGGAARERVLSLVLPAATLMIGVAIWEAVVKVNGVPPYVLPAPTLIARTLVADWPLLWGSLLVTLGTTLQGLLLAFVGGTALAILFNQSR
ncbi:MAG: ABC transporter permease, partial [Rhodoplanes sp.]